MNQSLALLSLSLIVAAVGRSLAHRLGQPERVPEIVLSGLALVVGPSAVMLAALEWTGSAFA
jgi:hypothetical protein